MNPHELNNDFIDKILIPSGIKESKGILNPYTGYDYGFSFKATCGDGEVNCHTYYDGSITAFIEYDDGDADVFYPTPNELKHISPI